MTTYNETYYPDDYDYDDDYDCDDEPVDEITEIEVYDDKHNNMYYQTIVDGFVLCFETMEELYNQFDIDTRKSNVTKCNHMFYVDIKYSYVGRTHYGKRVCRKCGKFQRWLKDPKLTLQMDERDNTIKTIFKKHKSCMKTYEQQFLLSIIGKRFLTEKQMTWFKSLEVRYK